MGTKKVHKDQCISCSICFNVCPYNAIEMVGGYPKFNESNCKSCYSCFNRCPSKSIYTKKLDGVGHYAKPHVNLIQKLDPHQKMDKKMMKMIGDGHQKGTNRNQ